MSNKYYFVLITVSLLIIGCNKAEQKEDSVSKENFIHTENVVNLIPNENGELYFYKEGFIYSYGYVDNVAYGIKINTSEFIDITDIIKLSIKEYRKKEMLNKKDTTNN